MKVLAVVVGLAAVLSCVNAGGYTAKGGVFDFKKPLDYYEQAVTAGTMLLCCRCDVMLLLL